SQSDASHRKLVHRDTFTGKSARGEGDRRSRNDSLRRGAGQRGMQRARAAGGPPHRQAAHTGSGLGCSTEGKGRRVMIPASFEYTRAASLRDALTALAQGGGAKVLAGGHSLIPMMRFRLAQPGRLIDIGRLSELKGITEHRRGARIGALTSYREVLESDLIRERFPLIAEATEGIGDPQVRNRGTIGGGGAPHGPPSDSARARRGRGGTVHRS